MKEELLYGGSPGFAALLEGYLILNIETDNKYYIYSDLEKNAYFRSSRRILKNMLLFQEI